MYILKDKKNITMAAKILTLTIIFSGIMTNKSLATIKSSDTEIVVSTVSTKLKSKEQVHLKGEPNKLSQIKPETMKFIKEIGYAAHDSGYDYGLYPSITIAQAVLESSSGKSGLSIAPNNNLFGIKGSYKGNTVKLSTKEQNSSGHSYSIQAGFKVYPNWEASLRDHDKLLRYGVNGLYSGAWRENAKTAEQAANALQGKYATDVDYASKLISIIDKYNLKRFDEDLTKRDIVWLQSDSLDPWELPIVEEDINEKTGTWATGYKEEELNLVDKFKNMSRNIYANFNNEEADEYYVEKTLKLNTSISDKMIERYKRDPEVGDVAIYKSETGTNKVIEKYAIVEGFKDDLMLISEGIKGERGIREIYRMIPKDSLGKYEFISIKNLNTIS